MTKTRTLTFPVLNEVKKQFHKCIGKPLTDDDRARAAQFDVAKEIEKAKAIRKEIKMNTEQELTEDVRLLEQQLDCALEFCRQYQIEVAQLKRQKDHLQFLLDSVMLEWCPDEMTEEQMENWSKHQKKSNLEILNDTKTNQ